MKNFLLLSSLLLSSTLFAADADSTGLEGDHLDLNAVMEIFKESDSPEDFEKKLNSESSNVNNLDLNEDGEVDYIRVVDTGDSISHALTLQVPVTETESQDVAVIEMEETAKDSVNLQVVGDEELYGENYILVPQSSAKSTVVVNVYAWRPVRHMWGPKYVFWVSPWRYKRHPKWFRPWKRKRWGVYHGHVIHHHGHCRRVHKRHFTHVHVHHYHRTHSASFHKKHHHKHNHKTVKPANGGKTVAPASKPGVSKPKTSPAKAQPAKQKASPQQSAAKPNQMKGAAQQKKATKTKSTQKKQNTNSRKRPGSNNGSKKKSSSRKRPGSTNSSKRKH